MTKLSLLLTTLLFGGCSNTETANIQVNLPESWEIYSLPGTGRTHIIPMTLKGGTRCVVVLAYQHGSGIACNWK